MSSVPISTVEVTEEGGTFQAESSRKPNELIGHKLDTYEYSPMDEEKNQMSCNYYFRWSDTKQFSFRGPDEKLYSVSGAQKQTVLEVLESSDKFKSLVKKNQEKSILIVSKKPHHADIVTHFPCSLIEEDEELTIKFSDKKTSASEPGKTAAKSEQLVSFYVARAGGPNLQKNHLKDMGNQDIPYLCVYGYPGETVKEALVRDGRFNTIVLEDGSELSGIEKSLTVEMCYKVNESLNGKRYCLKKE